MIEQLIKIIEDKPYLVSMDFEMNYGFSTTTYSIGLFALKLMRFKGEESLDALSNNKVMVSTNNLNQINRLKTAVSRLSSLQICEEILNEIE